MGADSLVLVLEVSDNQRVTSAASYPYLPDKSFKKKIEEKFLKANYENFGIQEKVTSGCHFYIVFKKFWSDFNDLDFLLRNSK